MFYKDLDDLIVQNSAFTDLQSQFYTNDGIGRIYGAEFMLRHALVDRFFGWVNHTVSRSERNDRPSPRGVDDFMTKRGPRLQRCLFDYDQTHIVVALMSYRLPRDFEISAKVQHVTGNPYTPAASTTSTRTSFRFQAQTGTGSGFSVLRTGHANKTAVHIQELAVGLYLDLLNAVRGQNPEFQLYNYDYTESTYIRGLPFIPSPGFEARINL